MPTRPKLSRRSFVSIGVAIAGAAALAACGAPAAPTPAPAKPAEAPKPAAEAPKPAAEAPKPAAEPTKPAAPAATTAPATGSAPAAAAPAGGSTPYTVKYWSRLNQAEVDQQIKFMKDNGFDAARPNVKVEHVLSPGWGDFWTKTLTAVAAGTGPDVIKPKEAMIQELAWKKGLVNLDAYVKKSNLKPADFVQQCWDQITWKGVPYALPRENWVLGYFMNKDLFTKAGLVDAKGEPKAPVDWNEWRAANKALQGQVPKGGFAFQYYEFTTREWNLMYFHQFLVSAGGKFWADDAHTKIDINSDAGVKALQFQLDMIYDDKSSETPDANVQGDARSRAVLNGNIATWTNGPWVKPGYAQQAPNLKYAVGMIPKDQRYAHAGMVDNHAITKDSKNVDASWDMISWFAQPDIDLKWVPAYGALPVFKANVAKEPVVSDPYFKTFSEISAREDTILRPFTEGYDEMAVAISTELQAAFFKQKTPKQALDAAKLAGEAVVAKARQA
jgi:ABC-type glycerol-3-phosphate transport system substrate-binding protein